MKCPSCGVENPALSFKCECGFDFVKGKKELEEPALFDSSTKKKSWHQRLWPEIIDLKTAEKASKQGVWAAAIIVVVTTAVSLIVLTTGTSFEGFGVGTLLYGSVYGLIAWGIHRKSRATSVFGLFTVLARPVLYMLAGEGITGEITAEITGRITVIFFLVIAFGNATRGTFAYHKFHAQLKSVIDPETGLPASEIPELPSLPMPVKLLGGVFLVGFMALFLYGIVMGPVVVLEENQLSADKQQGKIIVPPLPRPAIVLEGDQLSADQRAAIESLIILGPNERILYFCSDGIRDIEEGFYMLTDQVLILWGEEFWGGVGTRVLAPAVSLPLNEITSISVHYSDSSLLSIVSVDALGRTDYFPLSSENGGDRSFITALEELTGLKSSEFEPTDLN